MITPTEEVVGALKDELRRQHDESEAALGSMVAAWQYTLTVERHLHEAELLAIHAKAVAHMAGPSMDSYRRTPVTFANGSTGLEASLIPRAMKNLVSSLGALTPEEFYKELMLIHPWQDGNGRTGFLAYNLMRNSLFDMTPAPDFFKTEDAYTRYTRTASDDDKKRRYYAVGEQGR